MQKTNYTIMYQASFFYKREGTQFFNAKVFCNSVCTLSDQIKVEKRYQNYGMEANETLQKSKDKTRI